ncbi:P-loop containing nucleoside triphosphate hydrolase protein [Trematosphaeria pertusa]|uniref:P-loop containing nucleoside triphosphate hydrolase protein n=1 Tax=Trematosphaeria pertusa TaxID=390896 RepID=A0A6A6J220_9PLEO|nr:P-loop containing nucleoside triphosphate hydrolase protein [Trematosphaeria pertusa]KAF2256716.1 P-loop containing nucleoside triphosphate hydrolase protein [Trematosphaeria pertusa]
MSSLESNIRRVLDTLLPRIQLRCQSSSQPVILGITGLQGSGKSTWASKIVQLLATEHNLRTVTISLDDLYKTHDDLIAQRNKYPGNKLYRTRGQPGTHDEQLAAQFFKELKGYRGDGELKIPSFDKSKFNGEGDRAPKEQWHTITAKPDVVVFEGWCVGFRPLSAAAVEEKHRLALAGKLPVNTPANHKLEHLLQVNESLKRYCDAFMGPQHFDFMIHIDTEDVRNVYKWRLEQEYKLIEARGTGMKDEEVAAFIDGYMPAYELYLDGLRKGFFDAESGRQVRVVLDKERSVGKVEEL